MTDLMIKTNRDKPATSFISYADDVMISSKQAEVKNTVGRWRKFA